MPLVFLYQDRNKTKLNEGDNESLYQRLRVIGSGVKGRKIPKGQQSIHMQHLTLMLTFGFDIV